MPSVNAKEKLNALFAKTITTRIAWQYLCGVSMPTAETASSNVSNMPLQPRDHSFAARLGCYWVKLQRFSTPAPSHLTKYWLLSSTLQILSTAMSVHARNLFDPAASRLMLERVLHVRDTLVGCARGNSTRACVKKIVRERSC